MDNTTQPATVPDGSQVTPAVSSKPSPATLSSVESAIDQLSSIVQAGQGQPEEVERVLNGVVRGVLPERIDAHTCARVAKAFRVVLTGHTWGDASDESGASWALIHALGRGNKPYRDLLEAVRLSGEGAIKSRRIQAAHKRATAGWEEPVFGKNGQVGTITRYSDRLMELLLKGDDPAKYGREGGRGAGQGGGGAPVAIQINVVTADRSATTATIDASAADVTV